MSEHTSTTWSILFHVVSQVDEPKRLLSQKELQWYHKAMKSFLSDVATMDDWKEAVEK